MFYFQLAEKLGMPVGWLLKNISSKEIAEWKAYYDIKAEAEKDTNKKSKDKETF